MIGVAIALMVIGLVFGFVIPWIGIVVGLAVNMMVWPPLRDYSAAKAIDAVDDTVGEVLRDIARQLQETRCTEDDVRGWDAGVAGLRFGWPATLWKEGVQP